MLRPHQKGLTMLTLLLKTCNGWALNTFLFNPVMDTWYLIHTIRFYTLYMVSNCMACKIKASYMQLCFNELQSCTQPHCGLVTLHHKTLRLSPPPSNPHIIINLGLNLGTNPPHKRRWRSGNQVEDEPHSFSTLIWWICPLVDNSEMHLSIYILC